MTTSVLFEGKTYTGHESTWMKGAKNIVICGDNLYYHPDVLQLKTFGVCEIEDKPFEAEPLQFYEPPDPMDFIKCKIEQRLWNM